MKEKKKWFQEAVFYELYIRAFADANGSGHGDFRGAIEKLDHIKSLGVDCIWVMPMYPSPLKDDGYDVADYYGIHPDYGSLDDFKAFLNAAHERGLRVITDLVMNHTSSDHPWFQEARQNPDSPYRDYFVWSDTNEKYQDTRIIFLDTEASNWTYDEMAKQYFWHRFYSHQPDLNFDNPAVHEEMFRIIRFWMDMGIDGFRADAIPYLYQREGTNCENLPETHAFLKKVRRLMDEEYPDAVLIAEANQWPEDLLPYFGDGDEFQVCFHFPIMPRLYQALKAGDKTPIVDIWKRTPSIPEGTQWMTFLRNHDELTLEMVTEEVRQWMWDAYAPEPRMRLNLGIRRRQYPLLEGDKRRWFILNAMFLSLPGAPIIYYGDEIGMGDNIWLPDRNGVRTPMQWSAEKNGGFSTAEKTYLPVIDDDTYGYQRVNVAAQEGDPDSILASTRFLIRTRQSQPALRSGEFEWEETGSTAVMAFRRVEGASEILCLFNLADSTKEIEADIRPDMVDLLARKQTVRRGGSTVILEPFAAHWFRAAA
ncbi:MAG: maltose alpha-D-glucosyltransferase [Chloroflexi bacterium]|jgi:maltose alpha-D-glucosyltransferase/alpha-amylase|nr:maltose alpha-D-glucosyltransferase [Chloroflexota bacterium]